MRADREAGRERCECVAYDAVECWDVRHMRESAEPRSHDEVEHEGGPCDCACHHETEESIEFHDGEC
jgi:hypothetical protein